GRLAHRQDPLGQGTNSINPSKAALGGGITLALGTLFGIPISTLPPLFNGNGANIRAGTRLDLASRVI
ncbi:MAG: hypothetical protein WCF05_13345, partial [Chromatiaceae bacterium]